MDRISSYTYRVGSTTNILGRPAKLYRSSELLRNRLSFASVYAVTEADAKAIEEAGTAAGFKGTVWSQRLWVDFDTEESSALGRRRLKEMELDHVIYTTGGRGCHIGIARDAAPSHTLPMQDKLWVQQNLPGADLSLYWHLHLIRLPGALHERTGLPKRVLHKEPGRVLTLPPYEPTETVQRVGNELGQGGGDRPSIFQVWEVMRCLGERDPKGGRHSYLVLLAKALRDVKGLTAEEALWVSLEVNRGFSEPKDVNEVEKIIGWAYGQ